ncbi:MAG: hypothetical protein JW863_06525 [Chitinispirillaceae bacterium]|nr:hypothetical protein [Chitinispirillaceae bacterium]
MSFSLVKILLLLIIPVSSLFADEIDDLKVEIQGLKEKVTALNNRVPQIKREGLGFSIGFPTGLYNDDHLYGLEIGYFFRNHLGVRADLHFLGNTDGDFYQLIVLPSAGILGKSPLFYNFHTYGGVFLGGSKEVNGDRKGPYFHIRGFAGIELITTKKVSFFMEFGGGGILSNVVVGYTRGTLISGGSRIYF